MLIVISPARRLDFESPVSMKRHTIPTMLDQSSELVDVMITKSPNDLAQMMHLSPNLADLNAERFQDWDPDFDPSNARQAIFAFSGDVYRGMRLDRFDTRDFTAAQKRLRILSGLYGVLRPLDLMRPYRLEMGAKFETGRGPDLYRFWGDRITDRLNADLADAKFSVLVNLASNEYFGSVKPDRLDARIVAPRFLDEKDGTFKVMAFFAKRARGAMTSWIVRERIKSQKALSEFDDLGYRFDPLRSTPDQPTFVRPELARQ
ncbi:MAG: peroxide stress protein YaaA [Actinomycetia bacterium]|nr:peroxide stress protein YaaA [Actinomycetes bacterium]MCP4962862.1 peroxide stress protein YaaA [Actinomycetes bacterium]